MCSGGHYWFSSGGFRRETASTFGQALASDERYATLIADFQSRYTNITAKCDT